MIKINLNNMLIAGATLLLHTTCAMNPHQTSRTIYPSFSSTQETHDFITSNTLESLTECPICYEEFSPSKVRVTLTCYHQLCWNCLQDMRQHNHTNCALCQNTINFSRYRLPTRPLMYGDLHPRRFLAERFNAIQRTASALQASQPTVSFEQIAHSTAQATTTHTSATTHAPTREQRRQALKDRWSALQKRRKFQHAHYLARAERKKR